MKFSNILLVNPLVVLFVLDVLILAAILYQIYANDVYWVQLPDRMQLLIKVLSFLVVFLGALIFVPKFF